MNVIDSNILERDAGGKPLHTFPHPAPGGKETASVTESATGIVPDPRTFQECYPMLRYNAL